MKRDFSVSRKTAETDIRIRFNLDGNGVKSISTGIGFFDHMLNLFCVHGSFDMDILAEGDLEVDFHHTVEDVGLVLGEVISQSLGDRSGIARYGHAVTPMDEALSVVSVDLSNRPYLVFNVPGALGNGAHFDLNLTKEFFRALATKGGMTLHINVQYGENEHHIIESIFKAAGRAIDQATCFDSRIQGVRSTKGSL